jgi:mono/diheme cytochrome c family protein
MMIAAKLLRSALIGGILAAVVATVLMLSQRQSPHPAAPLTGEQAYGRILYNSNCAVCHEKNQLGLRPAPPDVHLIFQQGKLPSGAPATDAAVREVILKGRSPMPAFDQRLSQAEIDAILAYLHTGSH